MELWFNKSGRTVQSPLAFQLVVGAFLREIPQSLRHGSKFNISTWVGSKYHGNHYAGRRDVEAVCEVPGESNRYGSNFLRVRLNFVKVEHERQART